MYLKKRIHLAILAAILIIAAFYAYKLMNHPIYDPNMETDSYLNSLPIKNHKIEQTFICVENSMDSVSVKLAIMGSCKNVKIKYKLIQVKANNIVASDEIAVGNLKNEKFINLPFTKVKNALKEKYKLILEFHGLDEMNQIGVFYENTSNSSFLLNTKYTRGTIIMKVGTKRFDMETFIMAGILIGYIYFIVRILYSLFKA